MRTPAENSGGHDRTSPRSALEAAVRRLEAAAISNPRKNAEWMLSEVLAVGRLALYTGADDPLSPEQQARFEQMLDRRLHHEPLQYILGYTEFFGLRFRVNPAVLIPRPETEQLVESVLDLLGPRFSPRVLDVGTGSGCIAVAIASRRPDAQVWACDVDEEALTTARANADLNGAPVRFYRADALDEAFAEQSPSRLDVLVSNPPYISTDEEAALPEEVRSYEPRHALFAAEDPLIFYRRLAPSGLHLLDEGGIVALETHSTYGRDARDILERAGYEDVELRRDYAGHARILIGRRPPE